MSAIVSKMDHISKIILINSCLVAWFAFSLFQQSLDIEFVNPKKKKYRTLHAEQVVLQRRLLQLAILLTAIAIAFCLIGVRTAEHQFSKKVLIMLSTASIIMTCRAGFFTFDFINVAMIAVNTAGMTIGVSPKALEPVPATESKIAEPTPAPKPQHIPKTKIPSPPLSEDMSPSTSSTSSETSQVGKERKRNKLKRLLAPTKKDAPEPKQSAASAAPAQTDDKNSDRENESAQTDDKKINRGNESAENVKEIAVNQAKKCAEEKKEAERRAKEVAIEANIAKKKATDASSIAKNAMDNFRSMDELLIFAAEAKEKDDGAAMSVAENAAEELKVKDQVIRQKEIAERKWARVNDAMSRMNSASTPDGKKADARAEYERLLAEAEALDKDAQNTEERARRLSYATARSISVSIRTTKDLENATKILTQKMEELEEDFSAANVYDVLAADAKGLTREQIGIALTAITETRVSEGSVDSIFNKYDKDGDGWISLSELERMVTDVGKGIKRKKTSIFTLKSKAQVTSDETREAVFQAQNMIKKKQVIKESHDAVVEQNKLVLSNEEKLKKAEALAAETKLKEKAMAEEALRCAKVVRDIESGCWSAERVFAAFDSDKNGSLDISELQLALTSLLGKQVTRETTHSLAMKYDTDGNGSLDFAEFEEIAKDAERDAKSFFASFNLSLNAEEDAKAVEKARSEVSSMEAR